MNTKHILSAAILALLGNTAAMAQSTDVSNAQRPLTRAEVQAELVRAQAAGELKDRYGSYGFVAEPTKSALTRADVQAELARAIADGSINRLHDTYGFSPDVKSGPTGTRTREEVRAEAREAARSRSSVAASYGG